MADLASINIPRFDSKPREVAECWTLNKNGNVARCSLWTHPTRVGEVRVSVNAELHRSEANDCRQLLDIALSWGESFRERGWR